MIFETTVLLGLLGVLFGAGGLGVGVYSYLKQKKFEEQLEQKEELREAAQKIAKLIESLEGIVEYTRHPYRHEDQSLALRDLSRDILAYYHAHEEPPTVQIGDFQTLSPDSRRKLNSPEEALESAKTEKVLATLSISGESSPELDLSGSYYAFETVLWATFAYEELNRIVTEHGGVIHEFDNTLLEETENALDQHFTNLLSHIFKRWDGKEFHPENYSNVKGIGLDVHGYFMSYDGLESNLENLGGLINRLDDLRVNLTQTSYS